MNSIRRFLENQMSDFADALGMLADALDTAMFVFENNLLWPTVTLIILIVLLLV